MKNMKKEIIVLTLYGNVGFDARDDDEDDDDDYDSDDDHNDNDEDN